MSQYHLRLAAAYVRGRCLQTGAPDLPVSLSAPPLDELFEEKLTAIIEPGLRLHRLKQAMGLVG